jgi:AbrB family looped-hinge helix DNA binding protein
MIKSTVTSKGQITIPRIVRRKLAISAGDVLLWEMEHDAVRLRASSSGFLRRRGMIQVGKESIPGDIRKARSLRGLKKS